MDLRRANVGYIHDAGYLRRSGSTQLLVEVLDGINGGDTDGRRRLHEQTERFREIFNVGFAEQYYSPASQIGYHIKSIRAGKLRQATAMYLAWLCHKHPAEAARIYAVAEIAFRKFVGDPMQSKIAAVVAPGNARPPGLRTQADARLAAHRLVEVERKLNRLRYGEGENRMQADQLKAVKAELIGNLHSYLYEQGADAPLPQIASLYAIAHWSDRAAHESAADYNALAETAIVQAGDQTDPDVFRLILSFAQNFRMRNDPQGMAAALAYLPSFRSLNADARTAELIVDRADYALEADESLSAAEICDSFVKTLRGKEGVESAWIWRCEACLALSGGKFDAAAKAVERARELLKAGSLDTAEEKMIPHYLDAIEILVALRTGTKATDEIANKLDGIIKGVREIDDKAIAFIAGLYDALATVLLDIADQMGDRSGIRTAQALSQQVKAMGHLQRSVKLFCFFDIPQMEARARRRLESHGYLDPDPLS